jgi:UDP-GlcNAc:undecaprenyl-phosphate/decaprenyl-phosphate GlcNAc-1-phosphate transferase
MLVASLQFYNLALFGLSLAMSMAIAVFGQSYPSLGGRAFDLKSVQSMHSRPTPRVGGIAIFAALWLSVIFAPISITNQYAFFMLATTLIFIVGLLEDLGFGVSPRKRLLAAICSSLLAIGLLGAWLPRTDIPGLDAVIHYWFIGIPLTLLVTTGIVNGFNLIDGMNGLASMTAIVAAVAIGLIADQAGYIVMVHLALMLAAGVFGFFLVNYPFGRIFLGDSGAYTLGFVLSWFGIAILLNAPDASPSAIILVIFWPVADTLLAIYRRARRQSDIMVPDKLHMHQMVMRALEICIVGRRKRRMTNPLSTLVLAPFIIAPPVFGVMFWDQTVLAFAAVLVFAGAFFASYSIAPMVIRRFRRRAGPRQPEIDS